MTRDQLAHLLRQVADGRIDADAALRRLEGMPFEDLGFARVDHHRGLRCGFPEVIFGTGKTPVQLAAVFERLAAVSERVLATRVTVEQACRVRERFPDAHYDETARTLTLRRDGGPGAPRAAPEAEPTGAPADRTATDDAPFIAVVAAGTGDLPVAEEARVTAEMMDQPVRTFYDVGVAGLHRLLAQSAELRAASVIVVIAGMEGALPSVVGGLVEAPVIAVPTSVGYGASFGGLAALLAMLNSCAAGVSVVNIDNGFGAGYQAALICRLARQRAARASQTEPRRADRGIQSRA